MNDLPCLCTATYRCNQCRARAWHDLREPAQSRMRNNKLLAIARNDIGPDSIDDEQWSRQLYSYEADDLDRLLIQGGTA